MQTMAFSELIILDVGHGNCAIIKHGTEAIIVDAPAKPIVSRALDELGIKTIYALLISHADSDHLSGAIPLLLSPNRPVKHVYINPDNRQTKVWRDFRIAVREARTRSDDKKTAIHTSLNLEDPQKIILQDTTLHVLHPTPEMCLATTGGTDIQGQAVNANNMSAAVKIEHNGKGICLLAADTDKYSLEVMAEGDHDLSAGILVFPHHGGHSGINTDNREFARELVSKVKPSLVVFSMGRGSHGTPRPEIISGVREGFGDTQPYIACTQLSKNCHTGISKGSESRALNKNSDGYNKDSCCAGTLVLPLEEDGLVTLLASLSKNHAPFIVNDVPSALCRKHMKEITQADVIAKAH